MAKTSRYNETSQRSVRHVKRTIPVRGSGDDEGKWFRCWNCGFINNIDRNSIGDGDGRTFTIGIVNNDQKAGQGFQMSVSGGAVIMGASQENHNIGMEAISGCSLCGSRNYR